jgi:hypothetical protein
LLHASWSFTGVSPEGKTVQMGGSSSKLAQRGADGAWRYVLDMPIGGVWQKRLGLHLSSSYW